MIQILAAIVISLVLVGGASASKVVEHCNKAENTSTTATEVTVKPVDVHPTPAIPVNPITPAPTPIPELTPVTPPVTPPPVAPSVTPISVTALPHVGADGY